MSALVDLADLFFYAKMIAMKCLFLFFMLVVVSAATPSRVTWDSEVFLGASDVQYAVMRTHHDTLGSYYADESKTYFDEYSLESGKRIASTLLKTHRVSIDVDDSSNVTVTNTPENKELKLAEILTKYNVSLAPKAMPEWGSRLQWGTQGIRLDDSAEVTPIYSAELKEKYDLEQHKLESDELLGVISQIVVERGAVFLTLAIDYSNGGDDGGGMSSKVVYIPAAKAKRLLDWTLKEEIYLQAGKFETKEDAQVFAKNLTQVSDLNKIYYPNIQIWSKAGNSDNLVYLVVLGNAKGQIQNDRVEKLNQTLKVHLVPVSSEPLLDRFPLEDE